MPPQGRHCLGRSADHFLEVTCGEPDESRLIGTDNVEAFGVDFFKWNGAIHRGLSQRSNLCLADGAACQFIYALDAGKGAVAVETHRVKSRALSHHRVNCTTCRMAVSA